MKATSLGFAVLGVVLLMFGGYFADWITGQPPTQVLYCGAVNGVPCPRKIPPLTIVKPYPEDGTEQMLRNEAEHNSQVGYIFRLLGVASIVLAGVIAFVKKELS